MSYQDDLDWLARNVQSWPDNAKFAAWFGDGKPVFYEHFYENITQFSRYEVQSRRAELLQKTPESAPVGHKADHGKPIMGAIPPHAELAVARVLSFGADKYARNAWQDVDNAEVRYMDAALRHLNAHRRGELVDDESGEIHLAHAACCILFMLDMQERKGGVNNGN